jgi:hypothetical protein
MKKGCEAMDASFSMDFDTPLEPKDVFPGYKADIPEMTEQQFKAMMPKDGE